MSKPTNFCKEYKTVDERIKYLKDNKKIHVEEEQTLFFEQRTYASMINPFKEFFSFGRDDNNNHIYKSNTEFSSIMNLNAIDDEFCKMLYSLIGAFEKKFKTVLFDEICLKYVNCDECYRDVFCISYIDEIAKFIETGNEDSLPRFCHNYNYTISKNGYVKDEYLIDTKRSLLMQIKEMGTGVNHLGKKIKNNNPLIKHYLKSQPVVPLWIIPNALTLGAFNILFSMLDKESQVNIVAHFYDLERNKISTKKILSFSGILENIRRMRNIVSHYESIFPFVFNEMKKNKRIDDSPFSRALEMLEKNFASSYINKTRIDFKIKQDENVFTKKHLSALNLIKDRIKKK